MDRFKYILKGVIIAYIISISLIIIFSVLLVKTNIKEQCIDTVIITISGVSILIGTTLSTIKIKKYGIANGIVISTIYMVILYVASSVLNGNFSINLNTMISILCGLILGVFGGVIGVNIKS